MSRFWHSPSQRNAAVVVAVLSLAIGFLPLFGGPGYEHALASGLLVPSTAAIATALELSKMSAAPAPVVAVLRGASSGVVLALIAWLTAILHGLRVGFCELYAGTLSFVLTALVGAVLGGVWGACVSEIGRNARRRILVCVLASLAAPLFGAAVSLWRFYSSPMVFAFDPFVGYFSGTLYDTVIDAGTPLLTYRLGTLATLAAVVLGASLLARRPRHPQEEPAGSPSPGESLTFAPRDATTAARAICAAVALVASLLVTAFGGTLGHWQTADTISRELGGKKSGARCDAVYPDDVPPAAVALLVKDCDEQIASVEQRLGARGPERITAFFFRDAAEKKRLMGAGDTYIAKPWRREVYLQMHGYPHPVLGHEIAHVVAGSFGRGPFRVAGAWGGLWPNPGLIEGIAVAASPDEDELTDETWARTMLDLGILPRARGIFSIDFLGQSAQKSYTVAGAFIRWMMSRYGVDKVRALYGGAPPEQAAGKGWDALDDEFRAYLASLPQVPEAGAYAKAKFDRPAVFGRTCPHVIDGLLREADACRESHREERALMLYDDVLRRDRRDFSARYGRALTRMRTGETAREGRAELEALVADPEVPRTYRDRSDEAIADQDFLAGAFDAAEVRYRAMADRTVDEDAARTLEVKAMSARDPAARGPMGALLLGARDRGPEPLLSGAKLGAWAERTESALADYIIGKNVAQKGWYPEGLAYLDRARAHGPMPPRILRELLRMEAQAACAIGDRDRIGRLRDDLRGPASPFRARGSGRLESLERLLDRCAAP